MKPFTFDNLFELCPDTLKERINGLKMVEQRKDHHPEGNVYNHTKIVVNRLVKYRDINLSLAGLFHDIGKDVTTKLNEEGILQAIGHEDVSAEIALQNTWWIYGLNDFGMTPRANWEKVQEIVLNHMRIKLMEEMRLSKQMEMRRLSTFGLLQLFAKADSMKTLTQEELNTVL